MKPNLLLRLASLALAAVLAAPAAAQTIELQGSAVVYDFSEGCRAAGWWAGSQTFWMRYYPANLGDNPDSAAFSLIQPLGALGLRLPTGEFDNTFRAVEGHAIFGTPWTFGNARARFNRQVPARLTADTTGPVRITGQIRSFAGARGCDVRFEAVVIRTP